MGNSSIYALEELKSLRAAAMKGGTSLYVKARKESLLVFVGYLCFGVLRTVELGHQLRRGIQPGEA